MTPSAAATASSWRAHRRARAPEPFPWDVAALLHRCGKPEPLPQGGAILRNCLNESEQQWLYQALHAAVDTSSEEMESLRRTATPADMAALNPDNRPQPFVTWVHPYTRLSNAKQRPSRLLEWAEQLMHALVPASREHAVDSMLAQLYAPGGALLRHRDEDLSWGIGVSLGSAAVFDCLPEGGKARRVVVRSGDVLIGEFGQMPHAVSVPPEERPPGWWSQVDSFGTKTRCNVLFRRALSASELRRLSEERAQKVYGMSLARLRQETGKDDSFLAVHLRHAALE